MVPKYTLPIPPSVNKIWRSNFKSGKVYKTEEATNYPREIAKVVPINPTTKRVALVAHFYFERANRDIDSGLKTLLDSLQKIAYLNDSQVDSLEVLKLKDKNNPRVELWITELN